MFTFALAFGAGVAALHALPDLPPFAALPLLAVAALAFARRRPAAAMLVAGFLCAQALAAHRLAGRWDCARDREVVELTGRVAAPAFERSGRVDFDLEGIRSPSRGDLPRRARISWYDPTELPRPGELWRLTARLRCPRGMANPGAADRELDLLRQRLDATGYVAGKTRPERLEGAPPRALEALRGRIAEAIAADVPPGPSVPVLQGLAVGVRGAIPDDLWETFAVTGVAHLMAISGLHVTGCALFILAAVRLTWRLPWRPAPRMRLTVETCVVLAATTAYALLAGSSLPALRTLAMVAAVAGLKLARRSLPMHALLALAGLALVATDPLALVSAGFWLSMVATAALLAVFDSGGGLQARLRAFTAAQAAVTALLAPVLVASFGRVSLVAPFVNAVAIPFFSIMVLPAVLLATALETAWPGAAGSLWRALAALLDVVWPRLESVAHWPGASWAPGAPSPMLLAAAGTVLLAAAWLPLAGLRCAALAMLAAVAFGGVARPAVGEWTLTVVDVGQGLAAVVETERRILVFDAGPRWHGGGTAARVSLVPYLRARAIGRIDLLVVSHDDMDHAGGVETLRESFAVALTMTEPRATLARDLACTRGVGWQWDGVHFRVVHPVAGFEGRSNDRSCALMVAGPGGRALLLADAEEAAERAMLEEPLAADVVLLPHHGSRSSSSPELVAAIGARLGIASAGFGNRWGMPVHEVVARWRAAGTTVVATAEEGAVIVRFGAHPRALEVSTERGDHPRWWRAAKTSE
jgi:competence protein ComEC